MTVLLWLLIPLAGVIVAAAWVMWRSRPKRTPDAAEGMAQMIRLRQAMNQPLPTKVKQYPEVQTEVDETVELRQAEGKSDSSFRKSA